LGLVWIIHRFERPFVPKSCVQWLCVAAEKKEREGKRTKNRRSSYSSKKILLLKKKVIVAETKERKSKKKEREKQKVSIHAAILSLFCVTTFVSRITSLSKV
jgi:hypothetical protein